mmetsp:Transcript_20823/g.27402  ORF Transcript_20823/g.27402 Transcript_20823/m.27402 type:complete len:234 (+) Transcript_20823:30-731(+)
MKAVENLAWIELLHLAEDPTKHRLLSRQRFRTVRAIGDIKTLVTEVVSGQCDSTYTFLQLLKVHSEISFPTLDDVAVLFGSYFLNVLRKGIFFQHDNGNQSNCRLLIVDSRFLNLTWVPVPRAKNLLDEKAVSRFRSLEKSISLMDFKVFEFKTLKNGTLKKSIVLVDRRTDKFLNLTAMTEAQHKVIYHGFMVLFELQKLLKTGKPICWEQTIGVKKKMKTSLNRYFTALFR